MAKVNIDNSDKSEKMKALQLTIDKIEKNYGKGAIMKLGDSPIEDVEVPGQVRDSFWCDTKPKIPETNWIKDLIV